MKVVILKDVKSIGRRGDVKEVADGYAINYLFPKNFAEPATESALRKVAELKQSVATEEHHIKDKLDNLNKEGGVEFSLKVGINGTAYNSVKKEDVEEKLIKLGIHGAKVILDKPIKSLGKYDADVSAYGVKGIIKIKVVAE